MEFLGYTGYLPLILDAVVVIIFVSSIIAMARKGLVKSVYRLVSLVTTVVLVAVLVSPVAQVIEESQAGAMVYRNVSEAMTIHSDESVEAGGTGVSAEIVWDMPEYIKMSSDIVEVKDSAMASATRTITGVIIKLVSAIGLFIIIKLILALAFLLLEGVFSLPVLRGVNALAGILAAILTVLSVTYIVCGIISLNVAMFDGLKSVISDTKVIKMFYDYNFLMSMFI